MLWEFGQGILSLRVSICRPIYLIIGEGMYEQNERERETEEKKEQILKRAPRGYDLKRSIILRCLAPR
jgi:hypothetical protein